jgi:hypothetical protein
MRGGFWLCAGGAGVVSVVAVALAICLVNNRKDDPAALGRSESGEQAAASTPPVTSSARILEKAPKPVKEQEASKETLKPSDNEPAHAPKAESQGEDERVKATVKREMEARKQERQKRLAALALREQSEIPPLENAVIKIQSQIANLDKSLATLRAQQQSLPPSSGIPRGTKFQPGIPRGVRDIGIQGQQNWAALNRKFTEVRSELVEQLRRAQGRLAEKRQALEKERQQILLDD